MKFQAPATCEMSSVGVCSVLACRALGIVKLCCPEMVSGQEYTVSVGSASGTFTAN